MKTLTRGTVALIAALALFASACTNPVSPLDQLRECDTLDRNHAANFDADALTRCDSFDRSQPVV